MPRDIVTTVYLYNELSPKAQEKAREWWVDLIDSQDYGASVIEDALEVAECLGIDIDIKKGHPAIYWSGFSSQGDGASFTGIFRPTGEALAKVKEYAPVGMTLQAIAGELDGAYSLAGDEARCEVTVSGHYCHSYAMDYAFPDLDYSGDSGNRADKLVRSALRRFADWIYMQLEASYWAEVSDEVVAENLEANEYTFTAEGKRFG